MCGTVSEIGGTEMTPSKLTQEIDDCIFTVANRLKNVKQGTPVSDMVTMAQALSTLVDTRNRVRRQDEK